MFQQPPHPGWIPFVKLAFGFLLLVILGILSALIALGKVESGSSFGLDIILGGLLTLSGGFVGWAFRGSKDARDESSEGVSARASSQH